MSVEWFRDLVIIIFGLIASGVLVLIAITAFLLYRQMRTIQSSMKNTLAIIERVSRVTSEVLQPLVQVLSLISGIREGIESMTRLFREKKGDGHG